MRIFFRNMIIFLAVCCPLLVMYGIWHPVIKAFHIEHVDISDETVMMSRAFPDDATMRALKKINVSGSISQSTLNNIEKIAEDLIQGKVNLEGFHQRSIKMPFDDQAVFSGKINWRLYYAGFMIPKLFLNAYIETERPEFLIAALNFILGWDKFEQDVWSPESFVWNDHAVAARSEILANFWYHYKSYPGFDLENGRKLLKMATRQAEFLAREINYTFKTNHGTMQNIAILKSILFFPEIIEIQNLKKIAVNNLTKQFDFFINDEGVILEHSAEYHSFGLRLISTTIQLFKLLDVDISDDITEKYAQGINFLKALRRTDGTLPKLGDTNERIDEIGQKLLTKEYGKSKKNISEESFFRPDKEVTFKPAAGYAVWWSGLDFWPAQDKLTQTAITWSYFPFMGHKHADELSFNLWKAGQEWWTSIGYWPYTDNRRENAISWTGANGPHLVHEKLHSKRTSSVLSHFNNNQIKVIELNRVRTDGFTVRRQILAISDFIWITLDSFDDPENRQAQVVWNLHPTLLSIPKEDEREFLISGKKTNLSMDVFFRGADGMKIRKVNGLENPMAGWVGSGQNLFPSEAFIINQKSDQSWLAAISVFGPRLENTKDNKHNNTADINWSNPQDWDANIFHYGEKITVKRSGDTITVNNPRVNEASSSIKLTAVSKNAQSQEKTSSAYYKAEKIHGKRFLPFIAYREKMTTVLAIGFIANLAFLMVFRRRILLVAATSIISFIGLYHWLMNYYFIVNAVY